jgi:hypothetical protein
MMGRCWSRVCRACHGGDVKDGLGVDLAGSRCFGLLQAVSSMYRDVSVSSSRL